MVRANIVRWGILLAELWLVLLRFSHNFGSMLHDFHVSLGLNSMLLIKVQTGENAIKRRRTWALGFSFVRAVRACFSVRW